MCTRPIHVYERVQKNKETGKKIIDFKQIKGIIYAKDYDIPCGKCKDCLLKKAREWSVRCMHENEFHNEACFITLTYNNEHLPKNGDEPTLNYKDVQLFMKRLRKKLSGQNIKVRFFCASEYGGKRKRPHYHILLFGFCPKDLKVFKKSYSGYLVYKSQLIDELWQCGYCFIGTAIKAECASYIARYTLEKNKFKGKYFYENEKGEKIRDKEKITMSRRKGIGYNWFAKFWKSVSIQGYIRNHNQIISIPKYYRNVLK